MAACRFWLWTRRTAFLSRVSGSWLMGGSPLPARSRSSRSMSAFARCTTSSPKASRARCSISLVKVVSPRFQSFPQFAVLLIGVEPPDTYRCVLYSRSVVAPSLCGSLDLQSLYLEVLVIRASFARRGVSLCTMQTVLLESAIGVSVRLDPLLLGVCLQVGQGYVLLLLVSGELHG